MRYALCVSMVLASLAASVVCLAKNDGLQDGTTKDTKEDTKKDTKAGYPAFSEVEKLHGHVCPGSAIGYRMACAAMDKLTEMGITRRELMAIVENNMCGTDSLQCVTGCTFGKGRIIFDDFGKNVYTLFSVRSRKGARVAFRRDKITSEVRADRTAFTKWVLDAPKEDILTVTEVVVERELPTRTKGSVKCPVCGEDVNKDKMQESGGRKVCLPCSRG